jgi:hypothetical protein
VVGHEGSADPDRDACPGLGETALYWLQRASGRTLYALTPQSARDLCEYIHWQGSSDQAEWLEEMRSMGMTDEDLGDAISPDWYDGHFPDWVLRAKPVLDEVALSGIQTHARSGAGQLAVLLDIEQLVADGGQLPGLEGMEVECVYFGAYLKWDADDPVDRVFDDFIEYANCASDGYTDLFGARLYLSIRGVPCLAAKDRPGVAVVVVTGSVDRPDRRTAVSSINPAGDVLPAGLDTPAHFSKEVAMAINVSTFSSEQSYRLTMPFWSIRMRNASRRSCRCMTWETMAIVRSFRQGFRPANRDCWR